MHTYRVSYQNHEDRVIRNRHARIKADTEGQARQIVLDKGMYISIYRIELIK